LCFEPQKASSKGFAMLMIIVDEIDKGRRLCVDKSYMYFEEV